MTAVIDCRLRERLTRNTARQQVQFEYGGAMQEVLPRTASGRLEASIDV
jgi:hypothetical protein